MNYETKYGKQLLNCATTTGQILMKKLLYLIPALVFAVIGIIVLKNPDLLGSDDSITTVLALFFGAGALFILLALFFVKKSTAVLYEGGVVLTRGAKITEFDFASLKGIIDSTTIVKAYGAIPFSKTRVVTLVAQNGTKIGLVKALTPNFEQFADELGTTIVKRLLKGVTRENLNQLDISFGDSLELSRGQFIHDGKKGKVSIPLGNVCGFELQNEGYWLHLKGTCDTNGKSEILASIRADKALNLESLHRIIDMNRL